MLPPAVQGFYDAYNRHDALLLDAVLAPGYRGHVNGRDILGPAAARQVVAGFLAAFPDCAYTVLDGVREADRTAVRWEFMGTHKGTFAERPATGRRVKATGLTLFRVEGGRIAELWSHWDAPGLVAQLAAP
ncbi:MAG TPA: ester cyclase [Candidatus Thermoplasmatota archaeon]|nr:ester cyclase [Candidatus Thermoplasmatota archaeon]